MPQLIPNLPAQQREQVRMSAGGIFMQMAQGLPGHPLAQVIMEVSSRARQVLAGAGTAYEFTQQDVDALLEYAMFQTLQTTGLSPTVTQEQYDEFTRDAVEQFNQASDEEKAVLASMDAIWAQMRVAWAQAQAAQQQAAIDQWRQAYAQQYPQDPYWQQGYVQGQQAQGGGLNRSNTNRACFDIMRRMADSTHATSMNIINNMGSGTGVNVYDGGGDWLYSY